MTNASVCGNCRNKCASCGSSRNASHPVWVCMDCNRKYNSKCACCGQTKKGQVGAGKVCNSCYKINTCCKCGVKI